MVSFILSDYWTVSRVIFASRSAFRRTAPWAPSVPLSCRANGPRRQLPRDARRRADVSLQVCSRRLGARKFGVGLGGGLPLNAERQFAAGGSVRALRSVCPRAQ